MIPSSTSSQSPAHIDQSACRADMRQRPGQGNVAQIRGVVHEQLCNDMEAKQVDNLRIVGRKNLCQSRSKRKGYSTVSPFYSIEAFASRKGCLPGKFSISA